MMHFFTLSILILAGFESYKQAVPTIDHPITMIPMKGGTFQMGNTTYDDTQPVHQVKVDDFWMGEAEINWDQYEVFVYGEVNKGMVDDKTLSSLGIDGLSGATSPYVEMSFGMGKDGYPVVNVTQYAALMYCKWLTAQTGIFYRLPTEAEWEYACKKSFPNPVSAAQLESQAVFAANSNGKYGKSMSKKPAVTGLYDMLGNVAEWTMDGYNAMYYQDSPENNPWNKPTELYPRVTRGGSWRDEAKDCNCSIRKPSNPNWKKRDPQFPKSLWWHTNAPFVGFRIVRPRVQPSTEEIQKYWLEAMDDFN